MKHPNKFNGEIDVAKQYSQTWNEFRVKMGPDKFNSYEFTQYSKIEKLPFRSVIFDMLVKEDIIRFTGVQPHPKNRTSVKYYEFTGKPIHFSLFMKVKDASCDSKRDMDNANEVKQTKGTRNRKGGNLNKIIASMCDQDLVNELRARGYEVKAIKTIEL